MAILGRTRDLVKANLNSLVEKAENPEKLISLMVHEVEDALTELKSGCAGAMAAEKRVQSEWTAALDAVEDWGRRAERALNKGREDLARKALIERRRQRERALSLENELEEIRSAVSACREETDKVQRKLEEARDKRRMFVERQVHARDNKRAQPGIRRFDAADLARKLARFEGRIERMGIHADRFSPGGKRPLHDEIARLEADSEIERELDELKAAVFLPG
jgi:phage shock protein A